MNFSSPFPFKPNLAIGLMMLFILGCAVPKQSIASPDGENHKKNDSNASKSQSTAVMNKKEQVELSKHHLATELEVEMKDIELSGVRSVTWRSGAMGCPKPGMMYTQALVPGVLITLAVGGKTYRYHAATKGQPFHCPNGRAETPSPNGGDI